MADDDRIEKIQQPDPRNTIDLGESRGKGLQMISQDSAQGVTIVPNDAPPPPGAQGVVVSASDAAKGPADFDG